jgi:hyperosmotically inducible periplasmic protein
MTSRTFRQFAVALIASVSIAGAASAANWQPDAWVTAKSKLAMMTTDGVKATDVNVDTIDGRVTLHGKVGTEAEKAKAAEAVRKVEGVKDVRNLLQVVSPAAEDSVAVADDKVKEKVQAALGAEQSLKNSNIDVQSVNNGVVLLGGNASSLSDHLVAVEVALGVPGVRRVTSEIQSPDKLADNEIQKEADSTASSTEAGARDMWLTSKTKMRLIANSETPALDINVDTRAGVVTLFGVVPSATAKTEAEKEARAVEGVKEVKNLLQVVPEQKQAAVEAKDDEIKARIDDAMGEREALKDSKIAVEVKNGVVRLTGSVPSNNLRLLAATTARKVQGVRSVREELQVQPSA